MELFMPTRFLVAFSMMSCFLYADAADTNLNTDHEIVSKFDDDFHSLFDDEPVKNTKKTEEKKVSPKKTQSYPSQPQTQAQPKQLPQKSASKPAMKDSTNHFMVYGDYLYWQPFVTDSNWVSARTNTNDELPGDLTEYGFNFSWSSGFRVGLKLMTRWQDLVLDANWTQFYSKNTNTVKNSNWQNLDDSSDLGYLFPNANFYDGYFDGIFWQGKGNYKINYNQFDLLFKKINYETKMYHLIPFMGVRGLVINQSLYTLGISSYYGDLPATSANYDFYTLLQRNNTYAVGLVGGLANRLEFGKGFGFDFAADLYIGYGANNVYNTTSQSISSVLSSTNLNQNTNSAKFMTDITAGFDWTKSFYNNQLDLTIGLGYEFHYIFGGTKFSNDLDIYYGSNTSRNLGFQGLVVRGGIGY
jgi:hypothetical protein